ncbi:hypothetical protein AB0F44_20070 [Nocardioides sp. NPDC023903]|uniref:hypothetical protein n=1 Tax=Nocardioides sp. NPDC023903 TaxID=3157195 RepID=UPI0033E56DB3
MTMSSKLILAGAAAVLVAGGAFGGALALTGEDEPKQPVVEKKQSTPPGPEKHADPEEATDLYAPEGEVGVDH